MNIFNKIHSFAKRIAHGCTGEGLSHERRNQVVTLNWLAIWGLPFIAMFAAVDLRRGVYPSVAFEIVVFLAILSCFFLNKRGRSNLAAFVGLFSLIVFSFAAALFKGPMDGREFLSLAFVGLPIFLIDRERRVQKFFLSSLALIVVFFNQLAPPEFYINVLQSGRNESGEILLLVVGSVMIIAQFFYWENINRSSADKIKEQQAALTEVNRLSSLGILSGGVAHEINNPLMIIRAISEMLGNPEKVAKISEEKRASMVLRQIAAIDRVHQIVNSLKILSQDESREPMRPMKISDVVDHAISLCREHAKSKDIVLTYEAKTDAVVNCSQSKIGQVILSLISNSFDAVEQRKDSWVRVKVIEVGASVKITIKDSGTGISKEIRGKIMSPFFTTKPIGSGAGLGLSTSLATINGHGGTLKIDESSANTCFEIQLSLADDQMKSSSPASNITAIRAVKSTLSEKEIDVLRERSLRSISRNGEIPEVVEGLDADEENPAESNSSNLAS